MPIGLLLIYSILIASMALNVKVALNDTFKTRNVNDNTKPLQNIKKTLYGKNGASMTRPNVSCGLVVMVLLFVYCIAGNFGGC